MDARETVKQQRQKKRACHPHLIIVILKKEPVFPAPSLRISCILGGLTPTVSILAESADVQDARGRRMLGRTGQQLQSPRLSQSPRRGTNSPGSPIDILIRLTLIYSSIEMHQNARKCRKCPSSGLKSTS